MKSPSRFASRATAATPARACTCDPRLLLPLGLPDSASQPAAFACLRCGSISLPAEATPGTSSASEEPLAPDSLAWLARWPRLLVTAGGNDFACLPATLRCESPAALDSLRASAWDAQRHLPRGRRLRRAGCPQTPPPDSLPSSLSHYRLLWEAARFTPSTDLDTLLHWADPAHGWLSPLAIDVLLQRRDLRSLLPGLALSPVLRRRTVLCALAQEDSSLIPALIPHLRAWLQRHERTPDSPQKRTHTTEASLVRDRLSTWQFARATALHIGTTRSTPLPAAA